LAGRWHIDVEVKLTNPANFIKGTIKTTALDILESEPSSSLRWRSASG
jgi:hypothetical protein